MLVFRHAARPIGQLCTKVSTSSLLTGKLVSITASRHRHHHPHSSQQRTVTYFGTRVGRNAALRAQERQLMQDSAREDYAHGIAHLSPPWRIADLSVFERFAYIEHGPDYREHLSEEHREKSKVFEKRRAEYAVANEEAVGPGWYEMLPAAVRLQNQRVQEEPSDVYNLEKNAKLKVIARKLEREGATKEGTSPKDEELRQAVEELNVMREAIAAWKRAHPIPMFLKEVHEKRIKEKGE